MAKRSAPHYPLLILALLGSFLLFSGWSAYRAATRGSTVTDADYYSKGLKYNTTLVEKRAASVLGWQLQATLDGRRLEVRLSDGGQRPVSAAEGTLVLAPAHGSGDRQYPFREDRAGTYALHLPPELRGEFHARIEFSSGGARLNRQLLLNL